MKEFFDIAFAIVNLPLTILFGLMILYWILTTLTGLDLDFFDADIDVDIDTDVDMNAFLDSRAHMVHVHGTHIKCMHINNVHVRSH